jgi:hypothetical protein
MEIEGIGQRRSSADERGAAGSGRAKSRRSAGVGPLEKAK